MISIKNYISEEIVNTKHMETEQLTFSSMPTQNEGQRVPKMMVNKYQKIKEFVRRSYYFDLPFLAVYLCRQIPSKYLQQ